MSSTGGMKDLKLFPKHTGIWEGTYTRINPAGELIMRFNSRLTIRMFDGNKFHQVNQYFWDDGHSECHDFGVCEFTPEGHLPFSGSRISGYAWETENSICLTWTYNNWPGSSLYEMIDLIGDGTHRIRVWKWSEYDQFLGITMIEERRIATQEEIAPDFWERLPEMRSKGNSRSIV